ncbi:hemicentin-2 isoform X2 [Planococcus citri]|uniref:hemicentin-2 isoform X2 n=1 Tax=Planococcus citri TaxID=170843 RepID=UPI0031FA47FB
MAIGVLALMVAASVALSSVKASTQVDVSGLFGKEVRLPCQIDTRTCGTLHSIKWYRGSSRIYVFSDAIKFHKPEGDYSSRANLVYNPNDTTSYLEVKNLNLGDEAVYKCEITYLDVIESCLVVQFINLTALIEPKEIKVTLNGDEIQNGSTIGPYNEGDTVSLTCEVSEGKPIPSLYWYKDNKQTIGHYTPNVGTNAMGSAKNQIDIKLTRNDLGATYVCQSFVQGLNHSLSVHISIEVNVRPIKMELKGPQTAVKQNTSVTLICNVHQAKPGANVTWYNGSAPLERDSNHVLEEDFQNRILKTKSYKNYDGTIDTKSKLTFIATRHENYKAFRCRATSPVISKQEEPMFERELPIEVHYPPIITISPEEITVNETTEVLLSCEYVANPKLTKPGVWYFNGRRITENATLYDFFDTKLRLKKVDRNSLGSYFCSLENEVGVSNSSETTVNVLYPPTVYVDANTPTTVNETDKREISLICKVIVGNPGELNEVRWFRNGELMKNSNMSILVLDGVRNNHGNYSCAGKTIAGLGPTSPVIEVIVQRLPGTAKLKYYLEDDYDSVNSVVVKGSSIVLQCDVEERGWPLNTQYHWYKGNVEIFGASTGNTFHIPSVGIVQKLNNYSCNAANAAGYGENATIAIDVHAPPSIINTIKYANASIKDTVADIKCDFECYPECRVIWRRNGTLIDNTTGEYEILNVDIPADQNRNDFPGVSSTLRLNIKAFPGGELIPNRDDAQYTCASTANDVGNGVESNIDFRVHFPPINMNLSKINGTIREGHIPPRVICSSQARPQPTYRWYNLATNKTESYEGILSLNRGLNRFNDTTFVCEASNSYGKNIISLNFDFEFKPSCVVEPASDDSDRKTLYCKAIGNPSQIDYSWYKNSKEDPTNVTLDQRSSELILDILTNDERYFCLANNTVGVSEPCWIDVPASTDWLILRLLKTPKYLIYLAIAFGIIFFVIIICSIIIFICRKRRANEKYNNRIDLPSRQNLDANNITDGTTPAPMMPKWPLKPGVLVHVNNNHMLNARRTMTTQPNNQQNNINNATNANNNNNHHHQNQYYTATEKRTKRGSNDLSNKNKNSFHSANDALLQPENDKAFYENLPFHGMQNPPNKLEQKSQNPVPQIPPPPPVPPPETDTTRPPSSQSQYDGSSGYGSTRSRNTGGGGGSAPGSDSQQQEQEPKDGDDPRFNSLRPKRTRPNWPQFRSLRTPKKNKIPMLPIKESSPVEPKSANGDDNVGASDEQVPKTLPKPVPAPRKVIGFSFNKPSAKHTYQNVPIPITPNTANQNQTSTPNPTRGADNKAKASSHLTNSSPMEYFRLTPTNKNCRQYNGSITTNLSLKKSIKNATANNVLSPTFPRGGPPTVPRHHNSSYPSTHHLNNGLVYADLTVSRHKKKHHRHPPISNTQTYPYHTEYAVIKFHDVGREIDV